ncbi:MAG: nucleoside deaminase [Pseudorhodobacter sp.]|nr:nucleoside deaminase [Rhizobacter sp.]
MEAQPAAPTHAQMMALLRRAHAVALRAVAMGRHPFGALLVAPDHKTVLAEQGNIDTVHHAEATLARQASLAYPADHLWRCTLVTTFEPCAMCTATAYWANVGRIIYGVSEARLLELTGASAANPTLDLPCRELLARGQKAVAVIGPFAELEDELMAPHRSFWQTAK